jgi:hypothetical protein
MLACFDQSTPTDAGLRGGGKGEGRVSQGLASACSPTTGPRAASRADPSSPSWPARSGTTTDALLGLDEIAEEELPSPREARLMRRLSRVAELPPADQKAVLRFVEALLRVRGLEEVS